MNPSRREALVALGAAALAAPALAVPQVGPVRISEPDLNVPYNGLEIRTQLSPGSYKEHLIPNRFRMKQEEIISAYNRFCRPGDELSQMFSSAACADIDKIEDPRFGVIHFAINTTSIPPQEFLHIYLINVQDDMMDVTQSKNTTVFDFENHIWKFYGVEIIDAVNKYSVGKNTITRLRFKVIPKKA